MFEAKTLYFFKIILILYFVVNLLYLMHYGNINNLKTDNDKNNVNIVCNRNVFCDTLIWICTFTGTKVKGMNLSMLGIHWVPNSAWKIKQTNYIFRPSF